MSNDNSKQQENIQKEIKKALTILSIAHLQGGIDDDTIEKARSQAGVYANTHQNRKLGRVGQKYKEGDNQEKMPTREEISKVFSKAGWYSGGTIVRETSPGVFVFGMDEEGSSEENKKKIDKYLNDPEMGIKPLFKDKFNLDDIKVDISEPKSRGYGNPKRIYFTVDINKDKYSEPEKQILGGFTASIENKGISPKITITKGPHHVITLNVPNNIKGKENLEAYAREQLQQMKGVKTATDKEKKLKIEDLSIMELMSLAPGKGASKEEREKSKWVLDEIERRTKEHSKQKIDKIVNYLKENKMTTSEQELIDVAEVVNVNLSPKEKDMIREQYQSKDSKEGKHISDMKYSEKLAWAKELGIKKPESLSLKELNNQIIDHNVKKQVEEFKGKKEKDSLIEKYKENGLTLNIEKWDNLPEDISKFLKEKDVNRINNKLYKLSTRWESASDRGVDVSESYYDQVNDLQSIIENSLKEAGFSIEVGEGDDTTLEFNFK